MSNNEALWQMGPDGTCTYPVVVNAEESVMVESEHTVDTCTHEHVRQISEHDVECLDCGLVSA